MIIRHMQESFNAGEWSRLMAGRVSLDKYPNAVYRLQNFILDPRGPAVFRPGWRYIHGTKDNDKVSVCIPFQYSVTQAYQLEFGENYIRFYRDRAQIQLAYSAWIGSHNYAVGDLVTDSGNYYRCIVAHASTTFSIDYVSGYWTPTAGATDLAYEIPSPYAAEDVALVKYFQSADVIYLWHPDYEPRKLSRAGHMDWTLSVINFRPGPIGEQGFYPSATLTLSATTGTGVTLTASASVFLTGDVGRIITYGAGRASITGFTSATQVTCDILDAFSTVGPIPSEDWKLNGSPVGTITPSDTEPVGAVITLISADEGEAVTNLLSGYSPPDDNWTASASGTNEYYLGSGASFFPSGKPDRLYVDSVQMVEGEIGTLGVDQWAWGDNDTLGYDTLYVRLSGGGDPDDLAASSPYTSRLQMSTVSASKNIFRSEDVGKYVSIQSGLVKITSFSSASQVSGEIIKTLEDDTATATWSLMDEVWNTDNGYPSCGTFYEDRLCAAGSPAYPETVWGSVVGDYENFTPGADDSDSWSFPIGGREVSNIKWIEPDEYLLAGAVSKISRLGPDNSGEVLTPTNVLAKRQSPEGAANIMPVTAGNSILYVERTGFDDSVGLKIGELTWSWEKEKYVTPDMSILANHITKPGISGIAYQKEPNSVLWCYRSDGEVVALTYLREEDVVGWHSHPTDGYVESLSVIPGDGYDEVWAVIRRTVNGSTVRYIEVLEKVFEDDEDTYADNKGLNAFFVDCGITYSGASATVIPGLSHLEGEDVVALADGAYVANLTVSGGQVILPVAATVVHVGLPYTGIIETMRPELGLRDGTVQGRIKNITGGHIRVNCSASFKVGKDEDNLDDVFDPERSLVFGAAYPLFTGDVPFSLDGSFNKDGRITIVQDKPMPLTVVAIMQDIAL